MRQEADFIVETRRDLYLQIAGIELPHSLDQRLQRLDENRAKQERKRQQNCYCRSHNQHREGKHVGMDVLAVKGIIRLNDSACCHADVGLLLRQKALQVDLSHRLPRLTGKNASHSRVPHLIGGVVDMHRIHPRINQVKRAIRAQHDLKRITTLGSLIFRELIPGKRHRLRFGFDPYRGNLPDGKIAQQRYNCGLQSAPHLHNVEGYAKGYDAVFGNI
ncbi:MAG: hypothetical protein BWY63_03651 [Chloroflexi bacterium ADurb.Bin360]|nr:MAG: hypothetical protein BWY63_03651 [Chloroflexi bacterium ADurb.Bin360]